MENEEIEEELKALRLGFNYVRQRQEAAEQLLAALAKELLHAPDQAIEWAKRIDHMASELEVFEPWHAGIAWLRTLRDELVFNHKFPQPIEPASQHGQIRPFPPRDGSDAPPTGPTKRPTPPSARAAQPPDAHE